MNLGILSCAIDSYSTKRLWTAASDRDVDAEVYDTMQFAIDLSGDRPGITYCGRDIDSLDAVLPRIGASVTFFGTSVVRQFEAMDIYTTNTAEAIANSRDKLRAMQILARHDIAIPPTTFVRERADIALAIDRVGGAPVVIKTLEGTQGIGVILAPDARVAESILETLQNAGQHVLIQRFVSESRGRDLRAIVVDGRVVAAMRRIATGDEFRSNVHRGGRVEAAQLDATTSDLARRAAQTIGLSVCGVDMIESDDGPLVLEVNSSPGLEGIEYATGLDVAGAIIDHIISNAEPLRR